MKKFKVVCFTLLAASAIASTFYFTTAKAANSKNPDTIIETEEASTEVKLVHDTYFSIFS